MTTSKTLGPIAIVESPTVTLNSTIGRMRPTQYPRQNLRRPKRVPLQPSEIYSKSHYQRESRNRPQPVDR